MASKSSEELGINSWLEDELYQQYLHDRSTVDESWKHVFEQANGQPVPAAKPTPAAAPAPEPAPGEQLQPLRGAAGRIAENMAASVAVPLATSQRTIAVKVMDENRRIINQHRTLVGKSKVSYTHIIGWAVVKALEELPGINHAFIEKDGQPFRMVRPQVNLGIAVDVAGRDGARSLMVPNIKNAGALNFQEYVSAFDDLVARARHAKLTPADFQGTTISLTNPGTVGTMSSNPRLMLGQGAIIAAGAIDFPAEYQGAARRDARHPGHQQGDDAVLHLRSPHHSGRGIGRVSGPGAIPARWRRRILRGGLQPPQDAAPAGEVGDRPQVRCCRVMTQARTAEIAKEAGIMQLINAYPRARPPDRRSRSAGHRAQLPSRTGSGDLRPHHLGSGSRVLHRQPRRSIGEREQTSPHCARFWRRYARPTAAKSAAST